MIEAARDTRPAVAAWLFEHALPHWARHGVAADGRFEERLAFDGRPDAAAPRRTRVQARQIYVFCEAASLGWDGPAAAIAQGALDRLIDLAWAGRDAGWRAVIDAEGRVTDARPDLYDHAFVLFALAAAHRVLKDDRALPLALETLAFLDGHMADAANGGWAERLPPVLPRRQNPHMHMLEAMIAWAEISDHPAFAAQTRAIVGLFQRVFYDAEARVLGEFFTEDWRPAPGAAGQIVEPGHHFEWVWLLRRATDVRLIAPAPQADVLYATATACGLDGEGRVVDQIDRGGALTDGGLRLWGQCEGIRAHLATGHGAAAHGLAHSVLATHLATDTPGLWIDRFDAEGRAIDTLVPASSFYHLMTAFSELLRSGDRD